MENIFHGERNVFIYPCIVKMIEMIILKEIFNFRKKIYQFFLNTRHPREIIIKVRWFSISKFFSRTIQCQENVVSSPREKQLFHVVEIHTREIDLAC